jgi:hypothetical protein
MAGRPTDYREEYCEQVTKLCRLGATDKEIADFFEVTETTINNWKIQHTEFFESIKKGKIIADAEIAEKLYHRAIGYEHPDVDIRVIDGEIVETDLVKYYPPDPVAAIFWLKNRQRKKWRDKVEQGFTDNEGNDIDPVRIFKLPDNGRDNNSTPEGLPT